MAEQSGFHGYDAFLSYNREDESDVRNIYEYLKQAGLKIWFDLESIKPGDDWLESMQNGLATATSCLVFYRRETGVWQKEETKEAIRKRANNSSFKIIPVLLPGGDSNTSLPTFLMGTAWVDLRAGLLNIPTLKKLVEAIRGGDLVPIHQVPEELPFNSELPTGYRADVRKIIFLLIGEALYSRRDVSVRELIQNAVDACERRGNTRPDAVTPAKILIKIDSQEGYFDVIDNGDGMNAKYLSDYFAVIGRSIREEENIIERVQNDDKTRAQLIGKFGIGFISTYILARKILISTTYEGSTQINLEINGISDPFIYHELSNVGRAPDETGTTIRVYLKDVFLPGGKNELNVLAAVEEFCRHVKYISVVKDDSLISINENWNTDKALALMVIKDPFKFELHLGVSDTNIDFYASNAGFLINRASAAITPKFMPRNIGGEINFFPGVIDLNLARDTIIENEKTIHIRDSVAEAIKKALIKAAADDSKSMRRILRNILFPYLDLALKYETAQNPEGEEAPPLNSMEAAELLMDVWMVPLSEQTMPLREALRVIKDRDKYRVYVSDFWYGERKQVLTPIEESLKKRGFLVLAPQGERVEFQSGKTDWFSGKSALEYLSKKYYFDVYEVAKPASKDIEDLASTGEELSTKVKNALRNIEAATGKKILLSGLKGAPVVFELDGKKYLNISSELFTKVLPSFEYHNESIVKSYILGLLEYEITES